MICQSLKNVLNENKSIWNLQSLVKILRERKKNVKKIKLGFFSFHRIYHTNVRYILLYHSDLSQSMLLFKTPVKGLNGT